MATTQLEQLQILTGTALRETKRAQAQNRKAIRALAQLQEFILGELGIKFIFINQEESHA